MNTIRNFVLFTLLFAMATPVFAEAPGMCLQLSRNLKLGMKGDDVKALQQILNTNATTRVAVSGPGAVGEETNYFGLKTMSAVIKFQQMYASEVLVPAGLTSGSGYVGQFSRAKLSALCKVATFPALSTPTPPALFSTTTGLPLTETVVPPTVSVPTITPVPTPATVPSITALPIPEDVATALTPAAFHSETPVIMFLSNYTAARGAEVTVSAVGLATTGNVVHLGAYALPATSTTPDGEIRFVLPADAPLGKHELWISSAKGDSNKTFFVVTDPALPPPVISSISPVEGFYGQVVTVTGSGFLPTGNEVRISYGTIPNVPSPDGTTLQFSVLPEIPGLQVGEDRPEFDLNVPMWFSVANDNGLSEHLVFNLKI